MNLLEELEKRITRKRDCLEINDFRGLLSKTAHLIWEERGRPEGTEVENWVAAKKYLRELLFQKF